MNALPSTRHRLAPDVGLDALVAWDDDLVARVELEPSTGATPAAHRGPAAVLDAWIASWNAGSAVPFDGELLDWLVVPVRTARILETLAELPFGETIDYGALAARCGIPKGARAVGQAMARNPFPLLVPCHRVLLRGGRCGEYSAGGPAVKRRILAHEGVLVP